MWSGKSTASWRRKSLRQKVFLAASLSLVLLSLVGFGWLRNFLDWRQEIIQPLREKGLEGQLENELKNLAFREGLELLEKPEVYSGGTLVATFSGRLTCFFDLQKKIETQLASLQFVLWRSKIEGKKPRIIDLRFEKPAIGY